MLLRHIGVPARAGANQLPDGIVIAERPSRDDLPQANLVAIFGYLEVGALIDAQCRSYIERDGHLTFRRDLDYLHGDILTIGKQFLSSV